MDILFWSGGKDSYLALEFHKQQTDHEIQLLTTYNRETNEVPFQGLSLETIKKQAATLKLDLITVPLPPNCPNEVYLDAIHKALQNLDEPVDTLVFGDWKNQDIRDWREREFKIMGYTCTFPIWQKSLHELLPVLLLKPVEVKISHVAPDYQKYLRVGEAYDQRLIRQLPSMIDPMGENGEFHTEVIIHDLKDQVV